MGLEWLPFLTSPLIGHTNDQLSKCLMLKDTNINVYVGIVEYQ